MNHLRDRISLIHYMGNGHRLLVVNPKPKIVGKAYFIVDQYTAPIAILGTGSFPGAPYWRVEE